MTIPGIMARLEERGFSFQLAIDATEPDRVTSEDETLLSELATERGAAIEALIARHLCENGPVILPDDTPIPLPWEAELAFRRVDFLLIELLRKARGIPDREKTAVLEAQALAELWALNPTKARELAKETKLMKLEGA